MKKYSLLKTNLITGWVTPINGYIRPHKVEIRDLINNRLVLKECLSYKIYDFYGR